MPEVVWLYWRRETSLVCTAIRPFLAIYITALSLYCQYTVLAVSLLAKERNNVHAVELEALRAAVQSRTDKTQAAVRKILFRITFWRCFYRKDTLQVKAIQAIAMPWTTCQQHSITSKKAWIFSDITVKNSNLTRIASLQYCCQYNTQTEAPALSICNTALQLTHMWSKTKPRGCNIPLPSTRIHSGTRFMLVSRNLQNASTMAGASWIQMNPAAKINPNKLQCYMQSAHWGIWDFNVTCWRNDVQIFGKKEFLAPAGNSTTILWPSNLFLLVTAIMYVTVEVTDRQY